jgi:hypothetical protein
MRNCSFPVLHQNVKSFRKRMNANVVVGEYFNFIIYLRIQPITSGLDKTHFLSKFNKKQSASKALNFNESGIIYNISCIQIYYARSGSHTHCC